MYTILLVACKHREVPQTHSCGTLVQQLWGKTGSDEVSHGLLIDCQRPLKSDLTADCFLEVQTFSRKPELSLFLPARSCSLHSYAYLNEPLGGLAI